VASVISLIRGALFSSSISRWTQLSPVNATNDRRCRASRARYFPKLKNPGRLSLNVQRGLRLVFGVVAAHDRDYFPHLPCENPFPLISARCDDE